MNKSLELTWYEQDETGDYIHPARYVISSIDVDYWIECKRLTDSELAAESFAQVAVSAQMDVHALLAGEGPAGEAFNEQSDVALEQAEVFQRFATLPHFDEVA